MKAALITDSDALNGAQLEGGYDIPVYDDGYGKLYIHRTSIGISGIVRAQTWEDAYSICEDEFFPAADEEAGEESERIEAMDDGEEKSHAQACWDEAYGYRSNGKAMKDGTISCVYAQDLNGDCLDLLTHDLVTRLEISLDISKDVQ